MNQQLTQTGTQTNPKYFFETTESFYCHVRDNILANHPYAIFVTKFSTNELRKNGCREFVNQSQTAGYAINRDGMLIGVFGKPGSGLGDAIMESSIANGADKLECFVGHLSKLYMRHGFHAVHVYDFDASLAPEGWDIAKYGTPSYCYMER
jgi:hypothetical protein